MLAGVLLDNAVLASVQALGVVPGDFHVPTHALIYEAIQAVASRHEPVDVITLAAELRARERLNTVGGAQFLGELTDELPTTAHIASHARIVMDLARARRVAHAFTEGVARLRAHEPLDGAVALDLEQVLAREQRRAPLVAVTDALASLADTWEHPTAAATTGLRALDELLAGGLRGGDMVGVVGAAGGGKSAFVGQIALDAAAAGAAVVYASVEMPAPELLARWLALAMFRAADPSGLEAPVGYRDIYYGRAWRGEGWDPAHRDAVAARLGRAGASLGQLGDRVFIQQVEPGSTVDDLRALVAEARGRAGATRPLVLVVDPLQRLFASERGGRRGRAADAVNSSETERVGAVAQELKFLADTEGLAVLFTSDTTKAAALGALSSAGSMRGSYQINHLATLVLGVHTGETAEALRGRLDGRGKDAEPLATSLTLDAIEGAIPPGFWQRPDAIKLGACAAAVEVSKNRRGPVRSFALGFVPGATCFLDRGDDDPDAQMPGLRPRPGRKGR